MQYLVTKLMVIYLLSWRISSINREMNYNTVFCGRHLTETWQPPFLKRLLVLKHYFERWLHSIPWLCSHPQTLQVCFPNPISTVFKSVPTFKQGILQGFFKVSQEMEINVKFILVPLSLKTKQWSVFSKFIEHTFYGKQHGFHIFPILIYLLFPFLGKLFEASDVRF